MVGVVLGAAPQAQVSRYVMSLGGVPVGVVTVRLTPGQLEYESVQYFERQKRARVVRYALTADGLVLDAGVPAEVVELGKTPALGCRPVLEELTHRIERLCVDRRVDGGVDGTIDGQPFVASYRGGVLASLSLPGAEFERSWRQVRPGRPFTEGFSMARVKKSAQLKPVRVEGGRGSSARCLEAAQREVAEGRADAVVLGVVLEEGRGWPHAWVRKDRRHYDPSVPEHDAVLLKRSYLEATSASPGLVYLELSGPE